MYDLVDVWVVPLDRPDREISRLYGMLSSGERQRAGELPLGGRKRRYVARQAALRTILAQRTGLRPDALPLVRSSRGKPALAGEPELHFSVSDSEECALVAIATRDVGVDVERVRDRPAARRAAGLGIERFFEGWTRLEASGKALGTGLAGALAEAPAMTCVSLDVGAGFAAAVAVAAGTVEVRLRPY
jgi:4'-phosphopantetheinyl transferase